MIQKMLEAGIHVGHRIQRWNPAMAPYIHGQFYGIHIIDIFQTYLHLREACQFLAKKKKKTYIICRNKKICILSY